MVRLSSLRSWILCAALAVSSVGCNAAFHDAMDRGDALALAGDWDGAAASYQAAVNLDRKSPEAFNKLWAAHRKQATLRTASARTHLAHGELAAAVTVAREAIALDPQNPEAKAAYVDARQQALDRVEAQIGEGKLAEALELARVVRTADPRDQRAADLEGRCLDAMAAVAYDRAAGYLAQKKLGNALLSFREALRIRPKFRDAGERASATKAAIEDEIRFIVVVERTPEAVRSPLASRVEEGLLRWQPDLRFPLSTAVEGSAPAGAQAVRIRPRVGSISRGHDMTTVGRACDYVCGVDRVANPAHDVASRRANEAERRMHDAEAAGVRAQRGLDRARQEVTNAAAALSTSTDQERIANEERDRCESTKAPGTTCAAEQSRVDAARSAREAAETRDRNAKQAQSNAETEVSGAETEKNNARSDWEQSLSALSRTPSTILVDRICTHNYGVDVHHFTAQVTLSLSAQVVGEPAPVDLPPKALPLSIEDETFPPQPGRCAEVAAGDPLRTPSDQDIEAGLAARALTEIQDQVATWYASYVQSYRSDYESAKAAGRAEDANESYVRYLLAGPGLDRR